MDDLAGASSLEVLAFAVIVSVPNALVVSGAQNFWKFLGMLLLTGLATIVPGLIVTGVMILKHRVDWVPSRKRKTGQKDVQTVASALIHGQAPLVLLSWMLLWLPALHTGWIIVGMTVLWAWSAIVSGRILQEGLRGNATKRNVRASMIASSICAGMLYLLSAAFFTIVR